MNRRLTRIVRDDFDIDMLDFGNCCEKFTADVNCILIDVLYFGNQLNLQRM